MKFGHGVVKSPGYRTGGFVKRPGLRNKRNRKKFEMERVRSRQHTSRQAIIEAYEAQYEGSFDWDMDREED